jgi:S-adenosylmethionine:diacylglycerol 3-amino-3-carboxypropyl transferase
MDEFKTILLNDDFSIAYYSKKKNKDYATLKCKIKKEYPNDEEIKAYIDSINDFYVNKINKNIKYKIKLDTAQIGFIGFTNVYECVKCFRNENTVSINEAILIDTTIFISNSKLKYLLETIFTFLQPSRPVIFKCSDDISTLNETEEKDISSSIFDLFG